MKIQSLIIIFVAVFLANSNAIAAHRDTTYLDIKKIEITDTILVKSLTKYIDSLKKIAPTKDTTWYLQLHIHRNYGFLDTINTRYIVEYSKMPFNPDDPDSFFPVYYCFVQGIPMVILADRDPDFSISSKTVLTQRSKEKLIDILLPYTTASEVNYTVMDDKTGKTKVFKNYWPGIWLEKEYKLKLSITKTRKHNVIIQIKKQY
jgi:hypothetical protein